MDCQLKELGKVVEEGEEEDGEDVELPHRETVAELKERMTHRGVPLDGDGQGEEDGASEADVGQGQEEGDQVEEEGCLLDQGDHLGQTEQDDGKDKVQEVIACKAQQELVKVFLEHFSAEQEDGEAIANNSNAADTNLEKKYQQVWL